MVSRERQRRVCGVVSVPEGADPSGGSIPKSTLKKSDGFVDGVSRFRSRMRSDTLHGTFVSTLFLVQMLWTLTGTISAGWWWRYDDLSSLDVRNDTGEPICVGSDCSLYYILWDNQHVPNTMRCLDLFFLGCMWTLNTYTTLTSGSIRNMVSEPMFWINQCVMPLVTMIGALILNLISISILADVGVARNTISFFHPLRWISLLQFLNRWMTDNQALNLAKGNEYRAAVIKSSSKIVVLLMCFCFTFYLLELDPSAEWNIAKEHLDGNGDFDNQQAGYYHLGLWTSFYFTVITCSTVGYGDYSPATSIGYFVTVIFIILCITSIMSLFGDLGDAKKFGIVDGMIPDRRSLKDAILMIGPVDARHLSRFLDNIHCANEFAFTNKIRYLICIIPTHKHDECREVLKKCSEFGIRFCLIKGDIAFGSPNRDEIFSRLRICKLVARENVVNIVKTLLTSSPSANWTSIREIIIVGDSATTGDVVREARMTISRIEGIRRYIPKDAININQITTTLYNSLEAKILTKHARGNIRVESTIKAASIAKSVLHTPGIHVVISALFCLDTQFDNGGTSKLLTRGYRVESKDVDGTPNFLTDLQLMKRGVQHSITLLDLADFMVGLPYQVIAATLHDVFGIILVGIHNGDQVSNMMGGEHWDYWLNPMGSCKKELVSEFDKCIVVCNPRSYDLWRSYMHNHGGDMRRTLAYHLERYREGVRYIPTAQEKFDIDDFDPEANSEVFNLAMTPHSLSSTLKCEKRMQEPSDWSDAEAYFADPNKPLIVVFGTSSAWEELIKFLIIDNQYNILNVMQGNLPELQNVFCENLNFNWSHNMNYFICHGMTSDSMLTYNRIQIGHSRVKHIIILPGNLHQEERDENTDDSHVFATIDRLHQFFATSKIEKMPTIFFNIENHHNINFFTGLRGLQREGQFIKSYSHTGPSGNNSFSGRLSGFSSGRGLSVSRTANSSKNEPTSEEKSMSNVSNIKRNYFSPKDRGGIHTEMARESSLSYPIRILGSSVVHGGQCYVDAMATFLSYNNNIHSFMASSDIAYDFLGIRTDTHTIKGENLYEIPDLKTGVALRKIPNATTFGELFNYFLTEFGEIPIAIRRISNSAVCSSVFQDPNNQFILVSPPKDTVLYPYTDEASFDINGGVRGIRRGWCKSLTGSW
eukprot:GHVH01007620.1.p1 GENE.GHVH01007620.1~~GHVH01007620.1.p1  ORF type:complete len:1270 (+),score=120.37 GHVH01007620.1:335-3811(+)